MKRSLKLSLVAVVASAACASSTATKRYTPQRSDHALPADAMFRVVEDYAHDSGWALEYLDATNGVIVALSRPEYEGAIEIRERWRFEVDGQRLAVHRHLEARFDHGEDWRAEKDVCASYAYAREREVLAELVSSSGFAHVVSAR